MGIAPIHSRLYSSVRHTFVRIDQGQNTIASWRGTSPISPFPGRTASTSKTWSSHSQSNRDCYPFVFL